MKTHSYLFFLCLALSFSCKAAPYGFYYNERCEQAYKEFTALNLDKGVALIHQELSSNPTNLTAVFISDYSDFISLLFNGDKNLYNQNYNHLEKRITAIEKGSPNSPWYKITKAGLYLHWALVNIRMGDNYKGAINFRKAYLLAKENQNRFPSFEANKFFIGIGETVVGTLPDEYRWVASLFGMKGNVNRGLATLTSFINNTSANELLRNEAILIHCYLKFYLQSRQSEVWSYVSSNQLSVENNALNAFVKANLALNYRKAEVAIATLQSIQDTKAYTQFPVFDYELGSGYLLRLDDRAVQYFNRYLANDKGKLFIKDTWKQLAECYYLQGNAAKANYCRQQIKTHGSTLTDADKQALRFANNTTWPAVPVLKARYLIDGGYYARAVEILQDCNPQSLANLTDKLEYYFRMARAYDELNQDGKAIQFYKQTINDGRFRKEHFAARSALQLGMMYEKQGKKQEALTQYRDCLSMKNHDFQANIDQQAKAGINRLNP